MGHCGGGMMVARFLETSCNVTEALCCAGLGGLCGVSSAVVVTMLTFFNFC